MAETEYPALPDSVLAELVRGGDAQAFVELSCRYTALVYGKAAGFWGPSAPEREDLLQEGFLGLYSAALSFREDAGAGFGTYAGICVYRHMVDLCRSHKSAGNRTLNEALPLEDAGIQAQNGPEAALEVREQYAAMWRRIDSSLTPLESRALRLFLSGHKRQEAASLTGLSLKSYDNALARARSKLRKTLL